MSSSSKYICIDSARSRHQGLPEEENRLYIGVRQALDLYQQHQQKEHVHFTLLLLATNDDFPATFALPILHIGALCLQYSTSNRSEQYDFNSYCKVSCSCIDMSMLSTTFVQVQECLRRGKMLLAWRTFCDWLAGGVHCHCWWRREGRRRRRIGAIGMVAWYIA